MEGKLDVYGSSIHIGVMSTHRRYSKQTCRVKGPARVKGKTTTTSSQ